MRLFGLLLIFWIIPVSMHAQEVSIESGELKLYGTILDPGNNCSIGIVFISGSGKTDRDGNTKSLGYVNNCIKILSDSLANYGIASLRYDKRGVGKSTNDSFNQADLRFEHYVEDAEAWINFMKERYENIIVIGHSQGALVGLLASERTNPYKFISLAGMGDSGYNTLKRQLSKQNKMVSEAALPILDSLKNNLNVESVPQFLNGLFHPTLQEYLMSWLNINPQIEIGKLDIPVLFVQGTTDLQITVKEAKQMVEASNNGKLEIIENMNHVLRNVDNEPAKNMSTYSNPNLPLHKDLLNALIEFIREN